MKDFLEISAYSLAAATLIIMFALATHFELKGEKGYYFSNAGELYYIGSIGTVEVIDD